MKSRSEKALSAAALLLAAVSVWRIPQAASTPPVLAGRGERSFRDPDYHSDALDRSFRAAAAMELGSRRLTIVVPAGAYRANLVRVLARYYLPDATIEKICEEPCKAPAGGSELRIGR